MSEETTKEVKAEAKPPRAKEEIDAEYSKCALSVADFNFKIACMKEDLQRFYRRMYELHQELKSVEMPKPEIVA